MMRVLGAVVGGLLGLLAMYITYGANGGSYAGSATKVGCCRLVSVGGWAAAHGRPEPCGCLLMHHGGGCSLTVTNTVCW